ncbi:unnamed protein product [Arabis nemorensis]|uniref:Uncharacterized protein n=1 Tax=Arabis nemorensis TaxID=586526 RepID=A0A565BTR7_9BRAS|nr:unnamed protein product [Arabis nemorensis]
MDAADTCFLLTSAKAKEAQTKDVSREMEGGDVRTSSPLNVRISRDDKEAQIDASKDMEGGTRLNL